MDVNTSGSLFRVHGVRYQTSDVSRAVAFYTTELGCELKHQQGEAFAAVTCGGLDLLLSGAESSGARPLPDGQRQEPGGWNRLVLAVDDLSSTVDVLRGRGVPFRHDIIAGPADHGPPRFRAGGGIYVGVVAPESRDAGPHASKRVVLRASRG